MTDTAYAGRHRTASSADITCPRITVENISTTLIRRDTLYVSLVDSTTHNMLGINFGPDAIAALRFALGAGHDVSACICGTGRSVQCASPRHAVSLAGVKL